MSRSLNTESNTKRSLYWILKRGPDSGASLINPGTEEWDKQRIHLFIVTDAGKPVYSRYGSIQSLYTVICSLAAFCINLKAQVGELKCFQAGEYRFVVVARTPFFFIAMSKVSIPVSYLSKQLDFLDSVFLAIFSEKLKSFANGSGFRHTAEMTRPAWDGVVNNTCSDPAFIFAPAVPLGRIFPELQKIFTIKSSGQLELAMITYRNRVLSIGICNCDLKYLRIITDLQWTPICNDGEQYVPFFGSSGQMQQLFVSKHDSSELRVVVLARDDSYEGCHSIASEVWRRIGEEQISRLDEPLRGFPVEFYCWAVHWILHDQVYITNPDPETFDEHKMHEVQQQLAKAYDMVQMNKHNGEYMFRGESDVVVVLVTPEMNVYGVARSKDLPDEKISFVLHQLKEFIQSHTNELLIPDVRFKNR